MIITHTKRCTLWGVPQIALSGGESRERLGEIRASFHSRSAEEILENDFSRAVETVYAVIPARYEPRGGFLRGMQLRADGDLWQMRTPVCHGRYWSVKCTRVHV